MPTPYNKQFVDNTLQSLADLPHDKEPLWGSLTPPGLLGHLNEFFLYSIGEFGDIKTYDTFKSRNIIKPLLLSGIAKIPKGVKGVKLPFREGDIQTLTQTMNHFLDETKNNTAPLKPHPLMGPFTIKQWTRFHVLHCQHHLKQFDLR